MSDYWTQLSAFDRFCLRILWLASCAPILVPIVVLCSGPVIGLRYLDIRTILQSTANTKENTNALQS